MSGSDPALETCQSSAEFDWSHPEADSSHPRYEPPHLRHRPGDTWQIGGKPFDIDDTGPYGNPLWRPDHRTGRHRRGELPDPLPPETESEPQPQPQPEPEPSPPPVARPRPSPGPGRRGFWTETEPEAQRPHHPTGPERRRLESETDHPRIGQHRFDRLREDAWDDFMTDSAPLAAAHHQNRSRRQTAIEREAGGAWALWIALAKWLLALIRSTRHDHGHEQTTRDRQRPDTGNPTGPHRHRGPQIVEKAAEPLVPLARAVPATRAESMARAIAGAQRARGEVPAWA